METAENMAAAFEADAGIAPVVNVSGVDAPTVTTTELVNNQKFYTEEDLAKDLEKATSLGVQHISAYSLTVEPKTVFGILSKCYFWHYVCSPIILMFNFYASSKNNKIKIV